MTHALTAHEKYIAQYGLSRWVLRECVRANPLYVISAALLSYGVLQLNTEIDPQIGRIREISLTLIILHFYEFALLAAATVVLKKRSTGGDLHGLTIVAALFMGGSFLALDELITITPTLGFVLVPAALLLAAGKLAWYSRLPGIYLPAIHRQVGLSVLAGHSVTVLLGAPAVKNAIEIPAAQNLAWAAGWISLLPIFWLIYYENKRENRPEQNSADPLATCWCGTWMLVMFIGTGLLHLISGDWIFDRPYQSTLLLPWISIIGGIILLLCWNAGLRGGKLIAMLIAAPSVAAHWVWSVRVPQHSDWVSNVFASPAWQMCAAAVAFYVALAWATRQRAFYFGLSGPVSAPFWFVLSSNRNRIPHFRALLSAAAGFVVLLGGMLVSFYRERLLAWLDPEKPAPQPVPQVNESLP